MNPIECLLRVSEHRIFITSDNADLRLTPIGYQIGLISKDRYQQLMKRKSNKKY